MKTDNSNGLVQKQEQKNQFNTDIKETKARKDIIKKEKEIKKHGNIHKRKTTRNGTNAKESKRKEKPRITTKTSKKERRKKRQDDRIVINGVYWRLGCLYAIANYSRNDKNDDKIKKIID